MGLVHYLFAVVTDWKKEKDWDQKRKREIITLLLYKLLKLTLVRN